MMLNVLILESIRHADKKLTLNIFILIFINPIKRMSRKNDNEHNLLIAMKYITI